MYCRYRHGADATALILFFADHDPYFTRRTRGVVLSQVHKADQLTVRDDGKVMSSGVISGVVEPLVDILGFRREVVPHPFSDVGIINPGNPGCERFAGMLHRLQMDRNGVFESFLFGGHNCRGSITDKPIGSNSSTDKY